MTAQPDLPMSYLRTALFADHLLRTDAQMEIQINWTETLYIAQVVQRYSFWHTSYSRIDQAPGKKLFGMQACAKLLQSSLDAVCAREHKRLKIARLELQVTLVPLPSLCVS